METDGARGGGEGDRHETAAQTAKQRRADGPEAATKKDREGSELSEYDSQRIEAKWQKVWEEQDAFRAVDGDSSRQKYYMLEMLPILPARCIWVTCATTPSATPWRGISACADTTCCTRSAGTHSACRRKTRRSRTKPAPRAWVDGNIAEFRRVLQRFGFSYDWRREISTCDPEYYEWNQWLFLRMLEKQIAFRRKSKVNWCPMCQTVLANEQVIDGFCWRHETTQVEARNSNSGFCASRNIRISCSAI